MPNVDAVTVLLFLFGQVLTGAGVYAAIRADLREALTRLNGHDRDLERIEDMIVRSLDTRPGAK